MKTMAVTLALLSAAGPAFAASPFDGTWKLDLASANTPERPSVLSLKDGVFSCSSCIPAQSFPADGKFHPVAGNPYIDSRAVSVIDDRTVMLVSMKDGKLVLQAMYRVSEDGSELSSTTVESYTAAGAVTRTTRNRLTPAAEGAHKLSGSWRVAKYDQGSDNALLMDMAVDGDNVRLSTANGLSYQAKVGGPAVPLVGDVAGATITVRRLSPTVIEETTLLKGKVTLVQTYALEAGGKTLKIAIDDKESGATSGFTAVKQ
jgi:hypothetical protein